jgi:tetratricopeptide (TPR) repeat protein
MQIHATYRESIHELVDGTIGAIRRAELERHLAECAECRSLLADMEALRHAAGALDSLEPPDGVWLQIAGRLRQEGRVALPPARPPARVRHVAILAIAASLLVAVGAAIVMLLTQYRGNTPGAQPVAATTQPAGNAATDIGVESVEAEFRLAEQHYQNAIAKLEQAARLDQSASAQDPNALDAQTAAMLQKNLQVIDQAIAESRSALRSEPSSAPARDSLFDALRRKVALLQETIALMNEMRKGNSAGAAQIVDGLNKS